MIGVAVMLAGVSAKFKIAGCMSSGAAAVKMNTSTLAAIRPQVTTGSLGSFSGLSSHSGITMAFPHADYRFCPGAHSTSRTPLSFA